MQQYIDTLVQMQRIIINYLDYNNSSLDDAIDELLDLQLNSSETLLYRYIELLSKISINHNSGHKQELTSKKITELINIYHDPIKLYIEPSFHMLDMFDESYNSIDIMVSVIDILITSIFEVTSYAEDNNNYDEFEKCKFYYYVDKKLTNFRNIGTYDEYYKFCFKTIKYLEYIKKKITSDGNKYAKLYSLINNNLRELRSYMSDYNDELQTLLFKVLHKDDDKHITEVNLIDMFQHDVVIMNYLRSHNIIRNRKYITVYDSFRHFNKHAHNIYELCKLKELIDDDLIEEFIIHITNNNTDMKQKFYVFISFGYNDEKRLLNMLEYSLYRGSYNIFVYLHKHYEQSYNIDRERLLEYALVSNNPELVHYIEENLYDGKVEYKHHHYLICTSAFNNEIIKYMIDNIDYKDNYDVYIQCLTRHISYGSFDFKQMLSIIFNNLYVSVDDIFTSEYKRMLYKFAASDLQKEIADYVITNYDNNELIKTIKNLYNINDEYIEQHEYNLRYILYRKDPRLNSLLNRYIDEDKRLLNLIIIENFNKFIKFINKHKYTMKFMSCVLLYYLKYIKENNLYNIFDEIIDEKVYIKYFINNYYNVSSLALECRNYEVAFEIFPLTDDSFKCYLNHKKYDDVLALL